MKPNSNTQQSRTMEPLTVVKVGGAVLEDPVALASLLDSFTALGGRKVLVHGGGRSASRVAASLGVESTMVNGRRVTSEAMLDVVTMVYGGLVNKRVVARMQSLGVNAVGLSGADMRAVVAHKRPVADVDYGYVGDTDSVDADAFDMLIANGYTPVVAPLSFDPALATLLNTNADSMASAVAVALAGRYAVRLVYCFEMPGVLADPADTSTVIGSITSQTYPSLLADGTVSGGMVPKLDNSFAALRNGVSEVVITSALALADTQAGTRITL